MRGWYRVGLLVVGLAGASGSLERALAQQPEGQEFLISIFRVAPGEHLDFLKWQAEREAIAREAGAPVPQWYRHTNGDSWDFISIAEVPDPQTQDAQDDKIDELTRKKGLTTGFAAGLEFRQFIAFHTDTYAVGPFSAADLVQQGTGR